MDFSMFMAIVERQGMFAALFTVAFIFILKESKARENNQYKLFLGLADALEGIKTTIITMEGKIERLDNNSSNIAQDVMQLKFMLNSMEVILRSGMSKERNNGR